jgi:dynein heavy chain
MTPEIVVCLQECERMNILLSTIRMSLNDLDQGLKGALNITNAMEVLSASLSFNKVDAGWEKVAYFSKKSLTEWYADLLLRVEQLKEWSENMVTPVSVWISGLFNPMSFLTAIMQVTARDKVLPLDDLVLQTDVTNFQTHVDITERAEVGAYVHGFFLEGAGWELGRSANEQGYLTDMILKELHPILPVMNVKAVVTSERPTLGYYECPSYVTTMRGPTMVFTAWLKMESEDSDPKKWILAGVALLMAPE